jgi:DNA-directed RNA polymerase specialized sigma24 family protein/ribosome-associated translation inhibitor RaiA
MNVHVSYKVQKTPDIEKDVQHQVDKLRRRLQVFRPELIHLKGLVEQNTAREGFVVSLNLRLPSGQMAVQKTAPTAVAALKSAFEELLQQVTRHKDLLRSSHKWMRRRTISTRIHSQVPFESTIAAVAPPLVSAEDIRMYVNVNLARLELFVERELAYREAANQIEEESIGKEEIIDEVIAIALGDGGEKPERLALEPWLYRLAIRALDAIVLSNEQEHNGNVHLEASARRRNVQASDEPELQFHQSDESFTQETVIADRRIATPEQIASSDEMMRLVETALRGTDRHAREAFILHAMEGFTHDEIAAITDRKPDEVRASVTVAREHLRKSPLFTNPGSRIVASRTGTA